MLQPHNGAEHASLLNSLHAKEHAPLCMTCSISHACQLNDIKIHFVFKEKVADAAFKKRIENYKEHAAQIMDKQNKQLHKLLALRDVASSL